MKPEHTLDDDDELEDAAEPASTIRSKRFRIDPRLTQIAAAARDGELSTEDAIEQIVQTAGEWVGRQSSPEEQLGAQAALRLILSDPALLSQLEDDEDE